MQFVPEDAVYTYFRYDNNQTVMVVMNTDKTERTVDPKRFAERTKGFKEGKDIISGTRNNFTGPWKIPARTIWIMELSK